MLTVLKKVQKRPLLPRALLLITIGYLIGMAALAVFLHRASPGPESQELWGVGIGDWRGEQGIALLSGRRLACNPAANGALFTTLCRVDIAGKGLEIQVRQNQAPASLQLLDGECTAFYEGKQWPCDIGSRHVHVPWFAFIDPPLGLSDAEIGTLQQKYFFENLPEAPFLLGGLVTALVTTLLVTANFIVWFWPKAERKGGVLVTAVPLSLVIFLGGLLVAASQINGFWD